jgi:glycosyltransferase involved in cell wall biosynthesis
MRIGIDGHVLGKGIGGVERFLANVVARLPAALGEHQLLLFVDARAIRQVELPHAPNLQILPMAVSHPIVERSVILPWLVHWHRLDILMVQRLAPWFCGRCKLVVTVHDLTPIRYPREYRGLTNTLVRWLSSDSVNRAQLIFTPSRSVANDVNQRFGKETRTIVPFYNGVDTHMFRASEARAASATSYVLLAGAIETRKNIETVLRARALLGSEITSEVWIAGGVRNRRYRARLQSLAVELGIADRVRWLGFVDDAELVALYQGAGAFIAASRDEGFNIPPLEAMACGAPVLCSDIPVHRELFEGAALFFPPDGSAALAEAWRRLDADEAVRAQLLRDAAACVKRFTWQATADRVAAAFETLTEVR